MRQPQVAKAYLRRALPFAVVGALTILAAGLAINGAVKRHYIAGRRDSLVRDAALIARTDPSALVEEGAQPSRSELIADWQEILGARVQLLDSAGQFLADTSGLPPGSQSEGDGTPGPELDQAMRDGQGWDIRRSADGQNNVLYVAKAIERNGRKEGFVRLAVSLAGLDRQHAEVRRLLLWILVGGIAVIAGISIGMLIRTTRALGRLVQGASGLSEGDWTTRFPIDPYRKADEFTVVAHAFNRMADEVKFRFDREHRERAQLEAVLGSMNDGLLAVDSEGVVRLVNRTFLRYFRSVFDDPTGHTHKEAFRDRGLDEMIEKMLSGASGEEGELEVFVPLRRILVVRMAMIPGARKNEVQAVLLARDVTARRRLQELRRDFVANVSHELRTPLTSVLGYIEALRDVGPHSPEVSGFLDTISRNAERMDRIVGDLLELSRIEAPGYALRLTEFPLSELVREVHDSFRATLNQKDQSLTVAIADSVDPVVADRDAVGRILTNLVDNAHKYTPAGGHIMIEVVHEGAVVQLTVSDDGIGVPEADRARLFERFFRVDRARSRDSGGTGLGLAIVKHLAEAHGGTVSYEPKTPSGSCLAVRLPQPEHAIPQVDETKG